MMRPAAEVTEGIVDPACLSRKILWRLAVPAIAFMLLSSLDRTNISFAALQMNSELGFTPSQYGFGAGILFAGFLAGQYPSVLLLQRFGMRRWIAGCALLWGCCALAMAGLRSPGQFYTLRVLLGFAEGGLAPGIVIYLSQFATERERATTFALPMLAIPLSIIVGGPLSGWLMGMVLPGGLAGWRWMYVAEAFPTLVFAVAAWFYFPDSAADARWLDVTERQWLARRAAVPGGATRHNDWSVLQQPLVWLSSLLWFCLLSGAYGIMFWLPQILKRLTGLGPLRVGLINALPWVGVLLGMYFNSAHSDRRGERFWHVAIPAALAGIAFGSAYLVGAGSVGLLILFIGGLALGAGQGAFWAVPTTLLTPATFAVAAVAINICGSAGGLVMPHLVGLALERSGNFAGPTALIAGMLLIAALVVVIIRWRFCHASAAH
jgi:predicted MFS family arabinose efflux permease